MELKTFYYNSLYILGIVAIVVAITHLIMDAAHKAFVINSIRKAIEDGNVEVISSEEAKKMIEKMEEEEERKSD